MERPSSTRERRPSQATATMEPSESPSAARGCRPSVMSESNWPAPAENPSWSSLRVERDLAVADEHGAGMDEVAARCCRRLLACHDSDVLAVDDDAGAARAVRLRDRVVGHRATLEPEIPEGPVRVTEEEAPDDRLVHLVLRTPDVEPFRNRKVRDPDAGRRARVARRVERRHATVGERPPPEQVLDAVTVACALAHRSSPSAG